MVLDERRRPDGAPLTDAGWLSLSPALREWVWKLDQENTELRARLGLNSTNSSKPPSTDKPGVKKQRRPRSGRRPGGQVGHPGHSRPLVPEDRLDGITDSYPNRCRRCDLDLRGVRRTDEEPLRHQVAELPPIVPTVTEHRRHRVCCPGCGEVAIPELPAGVPKGSFGPVLRALLVTLCGRYRMSRREVGEFCTEALGLDVSVGTIDNMCRSVGEALADPVEEVKEHIRAAKVAHLDETGWSQKGERYWMWVAVAAGAAYFQIAKSRGAKVVAAILGAAYLGMIVTDRWSAYTFIDAFRRQVCWAHLKRDFQRFVDRGGSGKAFGEEGLALTKRLFMIWRSYEDERIRHRVMKKHMAEIEMEFGELLGGRSEDAKVRGFCKKLLGLSPSLFLFTRVSGVEPTNNRAERALRPVVLWRKGSFGTMSDEGSRFVERVMTAVMTSRLQSRSVLTYLRAVCAAQDSGTRIPSLLSQNARDAPVVGHRVLSKTG
jgi:transposase